MVRRHPEDRAARRATRTAPSLLERVANLVDGPLPVLPRPLDAVSRTWAGMVPRARAGLIAAAIIGLVAATEARVDSALTRFGGELVPAVIATEDLAPGEPAEGLVRVELPPIAVPDGALSELPAPTRTVAFALPAGAVLTAAHLDARGPAAGLPDHLRATPIEVEEGWGVVAGGHVDVWVLGNVSGAERIAAGRPVVEVRKASHLGTALVGLTESEVAALAEGLASGAVRLTHAPQAEALPGR